jgi:hypothetical protein
MDRAAGFIDQHDVRRQATLDQDGRVARNPRGAAEEVIQTVVEEERIGGVAQPLRDLLQRDGAVVAGVTGRARPPVARKGFLVEQAPPFEVTLDPADLRLCWWEATRIAIERHQTELRERDAGALAIDDDDRLVLGGAGAIEPGSQHGVAGGGHD